MEITDKDGKIDRQALKSLLAGQRTIQPRFRLDITVEQATDILLTAYEVEVEYRHRTFIQDTKTEENCRRLARFLTSGDKFGVMLCGTCGNGKTTMLHAFQSVMCLLSGAGYFKKRKGIQIVDAKEIAARVKDPASYNEMRAPEMLGIEDMGREATTVLDYGNVLNPVIDLLEYRYNRQLFTFITTNLKAKEIREKYGDRIADRFNEMLEVIVFGNTSYRNK